MLEDDFQHNHYLALLYQARIKLKLEHAEATRASVFSHRLKNALYAMNAGGESLLYVMLVEKPERR